LRDNRSSFSLDISLDIRSDISLDIYARQSSGENIQSRAPVATLPNVDQPKVICFFGAVTVIGTMVGAESLQLLKITAQLAIANLQTLG
jgi:hypothetical protein